MTPTTGLPDVRLLLRQLKWQLTLTYLLVSVTAVLIAAWWAILAVAVYLGRTYADMDWQQALPGIILPTLADILPSATLLILPAVLVSTYFGFLSVRRLDARLARMRQATTAWQHGNFSVRIKDESADEIGRFGAELNKMAAELQSLLQTRQELATLEERNRLARDLHDSVKQQLVAVALQIGAAQALLDEKQTAVAASLTEAGNLTHLAQRELGAIIFELQPVTLNQRSLAEALRHYVDNWSRQSGIAAQIAITGERPLPPEMESALIRYAQEALSNIARHSQAGRVQLSLDYGDDTLCFTIQDNGQGFDAAVRRPGSFGLENMRQRIASLGGQITLDTAPGQGTTLTACLPLEKNT
ncbi:MAG TPA: sensor histidine kinase [Chloroflexota bacterium]|nr:sensor histidine kinase [Chloroflexota bacterium]HUM70258.1 sensor histidine kinase [Chloroflexota bacterium]